MKAIEKLHRLAEEAGLTVMERQDDKLTVIGGEHIVHWWPKSRRMSAYVEGAKKGIPYATPERVIQLSTGGAQ